MYCWQKNKTSQTLIQSKNQTLEQLWHQDNVLFWKAQLQTRRGTETIVYTAHLGIPHLLVPKHESLQCRVLNSDPRLPMSTAEMPAHWGLHTLTLSLRETVEKELLAPEKDFTCCSNQTKHGFLVKFHWMSSLNRQTIFYLKYGYGLSMLQ